MSTDFDCKECKCVSCCGLREELETLKAKVRNAIKLSTIALDLEQADKYPEWNDLWGWIYKELELVK